MQLRELIKDAGRRLREAGVPDSDREAELLLGYLLGMGRAQLFLHGETPVDPGLLVRYEEWLRRRLGREPLAYIIGEREFWSLPFGVGPAVLIPRPETELLIEAVLVTLPEGGREFHGRILDLGTGSGVIAIVLALELPGARVFALDRSLAALRVARDNARRHGVAERLHFFAADMVVGPCPSKTFELVVANPPYVTRPSLADLEPEVRDFEPHLALDGGENGLDVIRRLPAVLHSLLVDGGWFFMEIGADQEEAVLAIFRAAELFDDLLVRKDYAGLPRVFQARMRQAPNSMTGQ